MDKLFLPLVNSQIAIIPMYTNYYIRIYFNTKIKITIWVLLIILHLKADY